MVHQLNPESYPAGQIYKPAAPVWLKRLPASHAVVRDDRSGFTALFGESWLDISGRVLGNRGRKQTS
jgi:hypothetical protein